MKYLIFDLEAFVQADGHGVICRHRVELVFDPMPVSGVRVGLAADF